MVFIGGALGVGPKLTAEMVGHAEEILGYKLPQSYLDILFLQNGGYFEKTAFLTESPIKWDECYVSCYLLYGIGGTNGIDADTGSRYLIGEWDYPNIGVVISSEGHTAFMLDYSSCGPNGEPGVVYVDTDPEVRVSSLASTFSAFIAALTDEPDDDSDDE